MEELGFVVCRLSPKDGGCVCRGSWIKEWFQLGGMCLSHERSGLMGRMEYEILELVAVCNSGDGWQLV